MANVTEAEQATEPSESRVRRLAQREGYRVKKARGREHLNNQGQFMLVEVSRNIPVLGWNYDAELSEIEAWLKDEA